MNLKLKEMLRRSVDEQATSYRHCMKMQSVNLENLVQDYISTQRYFPSGKFLDVVCGTGILAKMLDQYQSSETKMEYFGLDASPSMIQLASEHFSNYGHFIIGEAENIQFKSDIFNTVFSNSVLHWLNIEKDDSMEKALGEIFRVLIPGGVFAVSISGMVQFKNFRMLIVE